MSLQRVFWRQRLRLPRPQQIRRLAQATDSSSQSSSQPGHFPPTPAPAPRPRQRSLPSLGDSTTTAYLQEHGIPGLYSPYGFQTAWTDQQQRMIDRINELTAESPLEHKDIKDILLTTSRDPLNAALFNHASLAHNNHFFFSGISLPGTPVPIKDKFRRALDNNFSSFDTLRDQFLTTAFAMFAPGFVWLVRKMPASARYSSPAYMSPKPEFHILCTYAAGSPYAGAHNRLQALDMNNENAGGPGGLDTPARIALRQQHTVPQNRVGGWGSYAQQTQKSYGGVDVTPVLCVSTWEHAWLLDFTIKGKWQFLNAWWERVNWDVVEIRAGNLA